jgi:hypothetical protein
VRGYTVKVGSSTGPGGSALRQVGAADTLGKLPHTRAARPGSSVPVSNGSKGRGAGQLVGPSLDYAAEGGVMGGGGGGSRHENASPEEAVASMNRLPPPSY